MQPFWFFRSYGRRILIERQECSANVTARWHYYIRRRMSSLTPPACDVNKSTSLTPPALVARYWHGLPPHFHPHYFLHT